VTTVLLGMLGRDMNMNLQIILPENGLHLTCPAELRNWGFVGGSIDSLMYSYIFQ
jgi:hypothetical protein